MGLRVLVDGKDAQKDVSLISVIGNFPQPSDSVWIPGLLSFKIVSTLFSDLTSGSVLLWCRRTNT